MLKEFKKFITEGNVMDLAVAVIMGAAVKEMVDGLINGLIAPLIGAATAGINMKEMAATVAGVKLQYGLFLDALVKFIIIAFIVFLMVKAINKGRDALHKEPAADPTTKTCPYCKSEIDITATRCPHCTSQLNE